MTDYYTAIHGNLNAAGVSDIFQHSLAIRSTSTPPVVGAAIETAWRNSFGAIADQWPIGVTYLEATVATIINLGPTDPELSAAYHHAFSPTIPGTGSGSNWLPPQIALAVSVWAGVRDNGSRIKGRFYLPPPLPTTTTGGGLLSAAFQDMVLTNMANFLSALNNGGHEAMVWTRTKAQLSPISMVRVGNRLDTIRSRRNATPESYAEQSV